MTPPPPTRDKPTDTHTDTHTPPADADGVKSFFDLDDEGVRACCAETGLPSYAADQILDWVYRKGVVNPAEMTNLSARQRERLTNSMRIETATVAAHEVATDSTQKLLLTWPKDGPAKVSDASPDQPGSRLDVIGSGTTSREAECVMIPSRTRQTACVSSQAGCPVGCRFCASGLGGLDGNLSTGQIVEQVHRLARLEGVTRISNVVFMGMGEPLANYTAVTTAIRTLTAHWGCGIGARKITISTVGIPAAIRRLVEFDVPVTLALSLHAPNDEIRRQLIPWAEYSTIAELLDACDAYFAATGREITLEYLLIRNVNDRPEHARELADVAGRLRANVNLIRYNEVKGLPYDRPTTGDVHKFQEILRGRRINAHIRASRGRDIAAACGQLRHETTTAPDA